jgi:hypothetical protein
VPSWIKIGSGIQKFRGDTHTQTAWRYHKPNLIIQAQVPSWIKIGSGIQKLIGDTHTQTAWRYHKPNLIIQAQVPSLIKIGSGIQKLIGDTQAHRQHGDIISLILLFKIRKVC